MNQENEGGAKKRRIVGYVLGGLLILIVSAIVTYLILGMFYGKQGGVSIKEQDAAKRAASQQEQSQNRVITATSHRDFGAVCGGFTVRNAAPYTKKSEAIIVTFSQSPRINGSWSYEDVGYGKTYTLTDGDFTKISTVACLHEIRNTKVFSKLCSYNEDGQEVSVQYFSIRYKLSYYEAKTGERIADVGTVEAPAGDCPSFVAYDQQSMTAYATPESDVIDVAHSNFVTTD